MKPLLLCLIFLGIFHVSLGQSLAVNTDGSAAHSSAILDIKSSDKGVLIPRMTKAQRQNISSPLTGLLVFQNAPDSSGFYYYTGSGWDWINNPNPPKTWSISGNTGLDASQHFLGTTDNTDLVFRTFNQELMRIRPDGTVGIGNADPRYTLDINYETAAIGYCDHAGLRIKRPGLNLDCNYGLFLGYKNPEFFTASDALLWNYGQGATNKNLIFGLGDYEYMRLNDYGSLGIAQPNPHYTLDVNIAAAGVTLCQRNGLRISHPVLSADCDNGLFLGYDQSSIMSDYSLWNFNGGPGNYLRIGFGNDFSGPFGEAMRINANGYGVGIGTQTPQAMVHVQNKTLSGTLQGFLTTSPYLGSNSLGFYTGLNNSSLMFMEGMVWNYQNAGIRFGTSNMEAMFLDESGDLGIGNQFPQEKLHVEGRIRSSYLASAQKRVTASDNLGNILNIPPANDGDVLTLAMGEPSWQKGSFWSQTGNTGMSPVNNFIGTIDANDLVFRTSSNEAMRITWDGKIGVGTNNPAKQFEVVGVSSGSPVSLVIGNKLGFGPASLEFVSDHATSQQWRPGYIKSNDAGSYTGSVEIFTNGTGIGNLYGNVKGLEVRNGVTYTATGTVGTFSDARIKKNIHPFNYGLDVIRKIEPVTFIYNEHAPFQTDDMQVGIIAQDLEKIAPFMVDKTGTKDFDDLRTVNNQAYVFLLVNAVKEQDAKIEKLERQLAEQQRIIDKLAKKLE